MKMFSKHKEQEKLGVQKPLAKQITLVFDALLLVMMLSFLTLNGLFLRTIYTRHCIANMKGAYQKLNEAIAEEKITADSFATELARLCKMYNIEVVIVDEDSETVLSSVKESGSLIQHLLDNIFLDDEEASRHNKIYEKTAAYTIDEYVDRGIQLHYMSMWGVLDNGNLFMIRSAVESIRDSVRLTNRFVIQLGIVTLIVGSFCVWIVSKRSTAPILELARISKRMANLDFETKYTGDDKNEIGVLGHNFNEMSDTLKQAISELKTANNELQNDIEKKEQIDEMRKEFLANVSHELKTPIALVLGYAEGLKDCLHDDKESREFYCDVIMDEAMKMDNMVKKLLMLNQLEFGNENVVMSRFDIVEMIQNYVQSADILLKQHEVTVSVTSDAEHMFVWGDDFRIEEVIRNYCSNALNHVDENKKIKIDIVAKDDKVRVSVYNTGKQIPREALPLIWDKFYKVDKARTREYGGSGVGLSIVKAVMESMNQAYGVCNHDEGVEFWFELSRV